MNVEETSDDRLLRKRKVVDEFVFKYLRETAYETLQKAPNMFDVLVDCLNFWIDVALPYAKKRSIEELGYLGYKLVFFTYKEMNQAFISIICGAYLDAMRTLRFIFEMLVQAYVLERAFENIPEKERLGKILIVLQEMDRRHESFKMRMIDQMSDFNDKEKKRLKKLYSVLSEFSHPTLKQFEIEPVTAVLFSFDANELEKAVEAMIGITDLMTTIAIQKDPELVKELNQYARQDIEDFGMILVKNRLAKAGGF